MNANGREQGRVNGDNVEAAVQQTHEVFADLLAYVTELRDSVPLLPTANGPRQTWPTEGRDWLLAVIHIIREFVAEAPTKAALECLGDLDALMDECLGHAESDLLVVGHSAASDDCYTALADGLVVILRRMVKEYPASIRRAAHPKDSTRGRFVLCRAGGSESQDR